MTGFMPGFVHPFGGCDHVLAMLAVGAWAVRMGGPSLLALPPTYADKITAENATEDRAVPAPLELTL